MYVPNGMIMKNYLPLTEGAAYELTPTLSALAPFREQVLVLSGLECIPTSRTARRRPRESEHAVLDRRLAADQRDLARCWHLDGSDPGAGDGQADTAGLARAGDRVRRNGGRLRHRICLPVHEHDQLEEPEHAAADAEQPARRVRAAVRRQHQHGSQVRGSPGSGSRRSVLDSVGEEVAHLQGALPQTDRTKLTEYLDAIRDVEQRIQIAGAAKRSGAAARRSSCRHPGQLGRSPEPDVRSAGAGVSVRSHTRHHPHGGTRAQRHDLSADRRAGRASSDLAPPAGAGKGREGRQDQRVSRADVRATSREAAGDARRRRHAARPRDDDVRRGDGRQQQPLADRHPDDPGRRRRRAL